MLVHSCLASTLPSEDSHQFMTLVAFVPGKQISAMNFGILLCGGRYGPNVMLFPNGDPSARASFTNKFTNKKSSTR